MQTSQLGATVQFQKCQAEVAFHRKAQRDDGLPAGRSLAHVQQRLCASDGKWFVVSASKAVQFERLCKQVFERPKPEGFVDQLLEAEDEDEVYEVLDAAFGDPYEDEDEDEDAGEDADGEAGAPPERPARKSKVRLVEHRERRSSDSHREAPSPRPIASPSREAPVLNRKASAGRGRLAK